MQYRNLLFMLLCIATAEAQSPAFHHFGVAEGLPGNLVYHITQDNCGFIWMGTNRGLVRFDGERFKIFNKRDGLPDPEVLRLHADQSGRLWVSCFRQKLSYFYQGKFYTENVDTTLKSLPIPEALDFYRDSSGALWLADARTGLISIQGSRKHFHASPGPKANAIRNIAGTTWAINQFGIRRIADLNGSEYAFRFPKALENTPLLSVAQSGQQLLLAFSNMLLRLEYRNNGFIALDQLPLSARNVMADAQGRFWACCPGLGAFLFEKHGGLSKPPQCFLKGKKVINVFEDHRQNLWFSTLNEGVFVLPKVPIFNWSAGREGTLTNITALTQLPNGTLLAGDGDGNIFKIGRGKLKKLFNFKAIETNCNIRQLIPTPAGMLWVLLDNSVYRLDPNGKYRRYDGKSVGAPKAALWHQNRLFLANSGCLAVLDAAQIKPVPLKQQRITRLCLDKQGFIWAGTTDGLFSSKDAFQRNFSDQFPLLRRRILDLKPLDSGKLWVCSTDRELIELNINEGEILEASPFDPGLNEDGSVSSFIPDGANGVWLATNQGVRLIKNRQLSQLITTHNGLPDDEVKTVLRLGDTLWIASAGGLSCLSLNAKTKTAPAFSTYVTALRYVVSDQMVAEDLTSRSCGHNHTDAVNLRIPAGSSLLEMDFSTTDFSFSGLYRYEFISSAAYLPVFYATWSNLWQATQHFFYPNLKTEYSDEATRRFGVQLEPGAWKIQVSAITADGQKSDNPQYLNLQIIPLWYQTAWFSLLCLFVLFVLVKNVLGNQKRFHQMQADNAELQLQAIKARINPHFIGNSIQAIQQFFYPPDPRKASRYIALFTSLLRRTLYYSERDFIPFEEELNFQIDFLNLIKLRLGDRFTFEVNGATDIPSTLPFPSMLLQPILENATIHGLAPEGQSHLSITYTMNGDILLCCVCDNGPGYNAVLKNRQQNRPEKQSKGLELIEKKTQTLNGLFDIGLSWKITDLSDLSPVVCGSRVDISFNSKKLLSK